MQYLYDYQSPMGVIHLLSDEEGLIGVWFEEQKHAKTLLSEAVIMKENTYLESARAWLDIYFSGTEPSFTPKLHLIGTAFQLCVWNNLLKIPYGTTTTYKAIGSSVQKDRGQERMSAQAIGGAVGRNNISIIVPCHRVIGSDGSLTGYAGGLSLKEKLLSYEHALV